MTAAVVAAVVIALALLGRAVRLLGRLEANLSGLRRQVADVRDVTIAVGQVTRAGFEDVQTKGIPGRTVRRSAGG